MLEGPKKWICSHAENRIAPCGEDHRQKRTQRSKLSKRARVAGSRDLLYFVEG